MAKVRKSYPGIPILLISGEPISDEQNDIVKSADGFLSKPFSVDDLNEYICAGIDLRNAVKELTVFLKDPKKIRDAMKASGSHFDKFIDKSDVLSRLDAFITSREPNNIIRQLEGGFYINRHNTSYNSLYIMTTISSRNLYLKNKLKNCLTYLENNKPSNDMLFLLAVSAEFDMKLAKIINRVKFIEDFKKKGLNKLLYNKFFYRNAFRKSIVLESDLELFGSMENKRSTAGLCLSYNLMKFSSNLFDCYKFELVGTHHKSESRPPTISM
jgi:CheY-like chemotaxis protein